MKSIKLALKHFSERWYAYPLLLLFVGAVSYLYQLPRMGFYWDDWQAVFLYLMKDSKAISEYFAFDRPFSAWTYQFLFPLLPMEPWVWHIATFIFRLLGILAMTKALLLIWPERVWVIRWVGLLTLVAPAFASQPIALAFNQHFLTWLLFTLSILLTGLSITNRRWFWLFFPLALLATAAHLFTMEYFAGVEFLRAAYIYMLISKIEKHRWPALRNTFLTWLPFGFIEFFFIYWRLGIYPNQAPDLAPNDPIILRQLLSAPVQGILDIITRSVKDIIHLLVTSWVDPISPAEINLSAKATIFSWGLGILAASLAALWMYRAQPHNSSPNETSDQFHFRGLLLGIAVLLFGGFPVWLMARQITEEKWSDRFSLAPLPGAILILVILIDWMIRTKIQKHIILTVLLALSIAFQIRNVNKYRLDWEYQRDYYWQLVWRIPSLAPGTVIYSPNIPTEKISDYATTFAINTLYFRNSLEADVPYWFLTPRYLDLESLNQQPQQELKFNVRNVQFSGSTAAMVSIYYQPSTRCLKVLDDIYQLDPFLNKVDPIFYSVNNPSLIQTSSDPAEPSRGIFGKEPDHDWCYYFQKADLARQIGQWQDIIDLMTQAFQNGFSPAASSELLPLLDAYLQLGQGEQALNTAEQMISINSEIGPAICALAGNVEESHPGGKSADAIRELRRVAECLQTIAP